MSKDPKPGQRVAHKELDSDKGGSARSGVVKQLVGDQNQKLAVIEDESGKSEAYDTRELVALGKQGSSEGPVILKPRHLFFHLRRRPVLLLILLQIVVTIAILVIAFVVQPAEKTFLASILALLALPFLGLLLLKSQLSEEKDSNSR